MGDVPGEDESRAPDELGDIPEAWLGNMSDWQRKGFEAARSEIGELGSGELEPFVVRGTVRCGVVIGKGRWAGKRCLNPAGQGSWSTPGFGRCVAHGGSKRPGRALGAWLMAHQFARELEVSPWEGLLKAVRIAAGRVAYIEWVLSQAKDDLELEDRFGRNEDGVLLHPDTGEVLGVGQFRRLGWWVQQGELWVDRLAKYSKAAVDAGVAEQIVEAQRLQVTLMARPVNAALAALKLTPEQELAARNAMRRELLAIEAERSAVLDLPMDGRVVEGHLNGDGST